METTDVSPLVSYDDKTRCSEALQDAGKASWLEVNAHWILADAAVPLVTSSFSQKESTLLLPC